ncbi:hypothetical protein [Lacticaseibacillus paracasei]|uniref:hypothetical protein n=1 Tax=Lacticaseibacillus paracasei TaxID=1597 RepID=UPI00019C9AFB|nr:hypothetical protein [Lacticaseibacillus paracasei]EEI67760.1 hypothetical protein HMPREF0530_1956 [Lacticaseibacillus paracasei subsp. paracasei ATCC 25302 = DSM 5622 = JCM 8130]MBA4472978.1 hypothetical protein [Lacticaseibacillus paracasei]TDG91737.1 hypothetical protein C5L26_000501 [Lacticaseibacillus paracasei subsp. paracasei]GEL32245.1 hypothetical protein LPA04_27060 [Lacticaseibacillus paracasei subsp. paracasei]
MKIKVWTDSNNRLLNWAYADENRPVGPTNEGFEVIEVNEAIGLYENHASIVDGQVVPDADYDPDADRPKPDPSAADLANAETMKMVASLTMSNAALIKQVATLTKEAKS